MEFSLTVGRTDILCVVVPMGSDCSINICGGCAPHVGTVALAVPRPSLTGSGTSATVSVLNCTGHKDDVIACDVAKRVSSECGCVVTCTCGIHIDNATQHELEQLSTVGEVLAKKAIMQLKGLW